MFFRALSYLTLSLVSFAATAEHLDVHHLMSLVPEPNIKPTYRADGKTYRSGGIGIMVYDGGNATDALGPYQVFSSAGLKPLLISASKNAAGKYKNSITFNSGLKISADRTIADTKNLEVLVVPGGAFETIQMANNTEVLNWIKAIDKNSIYTTSVCTGSWILGAAGLLQGKNATSNWYRADELLTHFGAIPQSNSRYVFDGKLVTANGVTAGYDMALAIVQKVFPNDLNDGKDFTQAVMLDLQYDPAPPVTGGSPEKSEPTVFDAMQQMYDFYDLANTVKQIPIQ
ncbi:MAG: DJ-1/PfpI family protein [Methylobacter sp.]|nr:DJ-1/PfpI family protein [Methylobacter sp.]